MIWMCPTGRRLSRGRGGKRACRQDRRLKPRDGPRERPQHAALLCRRPDAPTASAGAVHGQPIREPPGSGSWSHPGSFDWAGATAARVGASVSRLFQPSPPIATGCQPNTPRSHRRDACRLRQFPFGTGTGGIIGCFSLNRRHTLKAEHVRGDHPRFDLRDGQGVPAPSGCRPWAETGRRIGRMASGGCSHLFTRRRAGYVLPGRPHGTPSLGRQGIRRCITKYPASLGPSIRPPDLPQDSLLPMSDRTDLLQAGKCWAKS